MHPWITLIWLLVSPQLTWNRTLQGIEYGLLFARECGFAALYLSHSHCSNKNYYYELIITSRDLLPGHVAQSVEQWLIKYGHHFSDSRRVGVVF